MSCKASSSFHIVFPSTVYLCMVNTNISRDNYRNVNVVLSILITLQYNYYRIITSCVPQ